MDLGIFLAFFGYNFAGAVGRTVVNYQDCHLPIGGQAIYFIFNRGKSFVVKIIKHLADIAGFVIGGNDNNRHGWLGFHRKSITQ